MIAQNKEQTVEYNGKEPLKGKREKFAQLLSTDKYNQTEAYREAGYKDFKGCRRYAHTLATTPSIMARIGHLRAEWGKKWNISRESQVKEYREVVEYCNETGDMANKNKALNSIDKLFGLSIDKQQTEQTDAQVARTAVDRREAADYAQWQLERSLARPEALQAMSVVDITGAEGAVDITEDNSLVGCSSGCSDSDNSAITGQEQR